MPVTPAGVKHAIQRLKVRNTFLEPADEDIDAAFLEEDFFFGRAATEPLPNRENHHEDDQPMYINERNDHSAAESDDFIYSKRAELGLTTSDCDGLASGGESRPSAQSAMQVIHVSSALADSVSRGAPRNEISNVGVMPPKDPMAADNVVSAGQAGHPNNCKECQFYYFSPDGCRAGVGCLFCHAIHPRKNMRKNRRLMKRIESGTQANDNDVLGDAAACSSSIIPVCAGTIQPDRQQQETRQVLTTSTPVNGSGRANPAVIQVQPTPAVLPFTAASPPGLSRHQAAIASPVKAVIQEACPQILSYTDAPASHLGVQPLTLVAGVRTDITARVNIEPRTWSRLEEKALFTVSPPLPEGLNLHPYSGLISGLPKGEQEVPSEHTITINIAAVGPVGTVVDSITLTFCTIAVRILDLLRARVQVPGREQSSRGYVLTQTHEMASASGGTQLCFTLQGP